MFRSLCRRGLVNELTKYHRQCRTIHSSYVMYNSFANAKERLNSLQNEPDNETKLKIYSLFKQATVGDCNTKKPGALDFVGKAKWTAWNSVKGLSTSEAENQYISLVDELAGTEAAESAVPQGQYKFIEYAVENAISTITFNRPQKKNALNVEMYYEIGDAMKQAAENSSKITVLTGAGNFYCSGNDLSNFSSVTPDTIKQHAIDGGKTLQTFVDCFIDFPKPLIAAVNGPAIGIAATTLGLCDAVYATESATFHVPLVALGQTAEGCASYTYSRIMGPGVASEVLLFGRKLSAADAQKVGLVAEVLPEATFQENLQTKLQAYAKLPPKALAKSKELMRFNDKSVLREVNARECETLVEFWQGEECMNAVMKFFADKQ